MKRLCYILLVLTIWFSSSCKIQEKISYQERVIYKDTVIALPRETVEREVPVTDTIRLETEAAEAVVFVKDDKLHGTITNKPTMAVKMPVTTITETITRTVKVKEKTKWGAFCTAWFVFSCLFGVCCVGYFVFRAIRK